MQNLSVRAQNVLKELAVELTGEQPPKGTWTPPRELLLTLTAERLATARNCGPHTMREIVDWAQACGVTISPAAKIASRAGGEARRASAHGRERRASRYHDHVVGHTRCPRAPTAPERAAVTRASSARRRLR